MKTFARPAVHPTLHPTAHRVARRIGQRLAQLTMVASVLAAGLVIQPVHAAEPVRRVIQLPTVVVIAKRAPVIQFETVVVSVKRKAPAATLVAERTGPAAAPKAARRV